MALQSQSQRKKQKKKEGELMANVTKLETGKYRIIISHGKDKDGKRKRISKTIYACNQKEAEKQAILMEDKIRRGILLEEEPEVKEEKKDYLFQDVVDVWRSKIEEKEEGYSYVRKTLTRYNDILDKFLIPYFGEMKVQDITFEKVNSYMGMLNKDGVRVDKQKGGYSETTKKQHKAILLMLLQEAIHYGWLKEIPYIENKRMKKKQSRAKKENENFITEAEIAELLERVNERPRKANGEYCQDVDYWQHKMFVYLGLATGLRLSELCGLEFKDINWEKNEIVIRRTSHYSNKQLYTQEFLKNGESYRVIAVHVKIMEMLREYREEMNKIWTEKKRQKEVRKDRIRYEIVESDRLFTKHDGSPINPSTISKWFNTQVKEWNIVKDSNRHLTVHGLRHTYASILVENGMDMPAVSKSIGHSNIRTTIDIYTHVLPDAKHKCANAIGDIMMEN